VKLVDKKGQTSVILADHVRSVDWRARQIQFIHKAPSEVLDEVVGKLGALISAL
jgi:mRNA interferase MazF